MFEISMNYMIKNGYLAESQKGFLPEVSGCLENQFQFKEILEYLQANAQLIHIKTDLSKAYRSVRHELLFWALEKYYFPKTFIDQIKNMYNGFKITMNVERRDLYIDVRKGVFEGEPLSVSLFLIVINLFLNAINERNFAKTNGVTRSLKHITNISFADDIDFVSRSKTGASKLLKRYEEFFACSLFNADFRYSPLEKWRRILLQKILN